MGYRSKLYHLYGRRNFIHRYYFLFSRRFSLRLARMRWQWQSRLPRRGKVT